MTHSLLDSLTALMPLGELPRTGWILRGVPNPESVAAHTQGVCQVVLALGPRVVPQLDVERALALAVVHDAPEAITGDLPRGAAKLLPAGAKAEAERRAAETLLAPLSAKALSLYTEYSDRQSREARFVRLCDRLQLGLRCLAYQRAGQRGLEEFRSGLEELETKEFEALEGLRLEILAALEAEVPR